MLKENNYHYGHLFWQRQVRVTRTPTLMRFGTHDDTLYYWRNRLVQLRSFPLSLNLPQQVQKIKHQ